MQDTMYRYLEKYVGTYRVKARYDLDTEDFPRDETGKVIDSFEDLFIECARGEIRHSATPYKLVWYTDKLGQGRNMLKLIEKTYKVIDKKEVGLDSFNIKLEKDFNIKYDEIGEDVMIWFDDDDMKKIASLVKPRTNGKSIQPFSIANLPVGNYVIPEKDLAKFTNLYKSLSKTEKMQFAKSVLSDYIELSAAKKRKKAVVSYKDSGLNSKEYIHYIGEWKDFLKFAKERLQSG